MGRRERSSGAEPRSAVVACLEDLVEAHEAGRPSLGNVDVAYGTVQACLAIAESHRRGGAWMQMPLRERDLYVSYL